MKPVVDFFRGMINGLIGTIKSWWNSFMAILEPFKLVWDAIIGLVRQLIPGFDDLFEEGKILKAGFVAMEVVLAPITKAFNLVTLAVQGMGYIILQTTRALAHWSNKLGMTTFDLTGLDSTIADLDTGIKDTLGRLNTAPGSAPGQTGSLGGGTATGGGLELLGGQMGMKKTSSYRKGDPGFHGIGRAMDFSNSTGPTPGMMAFAKAVEAKYGSNLKELIYTPLGYSIQNGKRVPAYAKSNHNNHVHVAYGMGAGNPAFFGSQSAAVAWEKKVAPGNESISSVTTRSGETGGSGGNTFNINVSGGSNATETAEMVAQEIVSAIQRSGYNELYTS